MLNDIIKSLLLLLLVERKYVSDGISDHWTARVSERERETIFIIIIFIETVVATPIDTHCRNGASEFHKFRLFRTINY